MMLVPTPLPKAWLRAAPEGRVEGVARMAALAAKLAEDGRAEDALAVMADPVAAEELLRKYGL